MFKKAVKIGAQNQLSGKDKKTIKSKLSECLDVECIEKIFASNEKIISNKVSGSKMLIFNGNDFPLFVDGTGKNNYFPSLYVAAAYEPLLKTLTLNQGVETYIFNGANLMWPGVRDFDALHDFKTNEVMGIRSSKGELIAVGETAKSKKQSESREGIALHILHYKGDKLWDMGPKVFPEVIVAMKVYNQLEQKEQVSQKNKKQQPQSKEQEKGGNTRISNISTDQTRQQKQAARKRSKSRSPSASQEQSESSDDDATNFMNLVHTKAPAKKPVQTQKANNLKNAFVVDENIEKNKKNKKKPGKAQKKGPLKAINSQDEMEQDDNSEQIKPAKVAVQKNEKKVGKGKGKKGKGGAKGKKKDDFSDNQEKDQSDADDNNEGASNQVQQKSAINSKLMDQYFKQSMLNAIKLSKIEAEIPIDSGRFYMDYMLPARPQGVTLDIKESTYKKIGKFFEDMTKKKFIQYKHQKDKKVQGALINKIFWENEQIKNYVPTVKKLASKEEQEKVNSSGNNKIKLKLSKTVECQTVYKPSAQLFEHAFKKPLNLMPSQSDEEVSDKQEIKHMTEKELIEGIEKYINKISQNPKEGGKKIGKHVFVDYKKSPFLSQLCKFYMIYNKYSEKIDLGI